MANLRDLTFGLYEAPMEPKLWPGLMASLAEMSQSDIAGVCSYYNKEQHWWFSSLKPKMRTALELHTSDGDESVLVQALKQPQPKLVQTARWLPAGFAESAFCREFFKAHGFPPEGGCLGDLLNDGKNISRFAVFRQSRKPYDSRSLRNLSSLWPHLTRAVQLTLKLLPTAGTELAPSSVFDLCLMGVITIDAERRVLDTNTVGRSLLDRRAALTCEGGYLMACNAETQAKLDRAVSLVSEREHEPAESFLVSTASAEQPLAVCVMRVTAAIRRAVGTRASAVVLVQNPGEGLCFDRTLLQKVYGLTYAEATVAASIAAGRAVADIAAQMSLSRHTIRSHLYRVFDKLHVRHQSELTHLLLAGPFAINPLGHRG